MDQEDISSTHTQGSKLLRNFGSAALFHALLRQWPRVMPAPHAEVNHPRSIVRTGCERIYYPTPIRRAASHAAFPVQDPPVYT